MTPEQIARFWAHVDKSGNCWLWTASTKSDGYGAYHLAGVRGYAHRLAWELTHGPIPAGLYVCHHCDTPPCVNPAHLFLGTAKDNTADMLRKGRGPGRAPKVRVNRPPAKIGRPSKLTSEDIYVIRTCCALGHHTVKRLLAQEYGVSRHTIDRIARNNP